MKPLSLSSSSFAHHSPLADVSINHPLQRVTRQTTAVRRRNPTTIVRLSLVRLEYRSSPTPNPPPSRRHMSLTPSPRRVTQPSLCYPTVVASSNLPDDDHRHRAQPLYDGVLKQSIRSVQSIQVSSFCFIISRAVHHLTIVRRHSASRIISNLVLFNSLSWI